MSDTNMFFSRSHLAICYLVVFVFSLTYLQCEGLDADSGSRGLQQDEKAKERTLLLPLGLIALLKFRPLWKNFMGNFHGYGSFGGTFGGGSYYTGQQYYPFIPGTVGVGGFGGLGGVGVHAGISGIGYPGLFPTGYPYPVAAGPIAQTTLNRKGQPRPRPPQLNVQPVDEASRFDELHELETTTVKRKTQITLEHDEETTQKPGVVQSIREFASPLFHVGQRVESRANSRKPYHFSPTG